MKKEIKIHKRVLKLIIYKNSYKARQKRCFFVKNVVK